MYEDPVSPHLLEQQGLFVFNPDAVELALEFQHAGETQVPQEALELVHLTAAEYALAPLIAEPRQVLPLQQPLPVEPRSVALALVKADCVFFEWCVRDPARYTLADVTAFSGDIAKLAALGVSIDDPPREIGDMARIVDELEQAHRTGPGLAAMLGDSGVLRLQGFLWAVKLSLTRTPLDEAVSNAFEAFELSEPVGGAQVPTPAG